MERINLRYLIYFMDFPDVRPSQRDKLQHILYNNGARFIRQLCKMSYDEFIAIPELTPEIKQAVISSMAKYGLKVGMTEQEIISYIDEDYLKEHPESDSEGSIIPEIQNKTEQEEEKPSEEDLVEDDNPIEEEIPIEAEEDDKPNKTIEERLLSLERDLVLNYDPIQFHPNDLEYTFHLNAINELYNQPWWKKLFWSRHKRMLDAICKTIEFHNYRMIAMKSRATATDSLRSEQKQQIDDLSEELNKA